MFGAVALKIHLNSDIGKSVPFASAASAAHLNAEGVLSDTAGGAAGSGEAGSKFLKISGSSDFGKKGEKTTKLPHYGMWLKTANDSNSFNVTSVTKNENNLTFTYENGTEGDFLTFIAYQGDDVKAENSSLVGTYKLTATSGNAVVPLPSDFNWTDYSLQVWSEKNGNASLAQATTPKAFDFADGSFSAVTAPKFSNPRVFALKDDLKTSWGKVTKEMIDNSDATEGIVGEHATNQKILLGSSNAGITEDNANDPGNCREFWIAGREDADGNIAENGEYLVLYQAHCPTADNLKFNASSSAYSKGNAADNVTQALPQLKISNTEPINLSGEEVVDGANGYNGKFTTSYTSDGTAAITDGGAISYQHTKAKTDTPTDKSTYSVDDTDWHDGLPTEAGQFLVRALAGATDTYSQVYSAPVAVNIEGVNFDDAYNLTISHDETTCSEDKKLRVGCNLKAKLELKEGHTAIDGAKVKYQWTRKKNGSEAAENIGTEQEALLSEFAPTYTIQQEDDNATIGLIVNSESYVGPATALYKVDVPNNNNLSIKFTGNYTYDGTAPEVTESGKDENNTTPITYSHAPYRDEYDSDITTAASATFEDGIPTKAGEHVIKAVQNESADAVYSGATVYTKLTIKKKPLTVQVEVKNKTYDGTETATYAEGFPRLSGVVKGDNVTLKTPLPTPTFVDKEIGKDKIINLGGNFELAGDPSKISNYELTRLEAGSIKANIEDFNTVILSDTSEMRFVRGDENTTVNVTLKCTSDTSSKFVVVRTSNAEVADFEGAESAIVEISNNPDANTELDATITAKITLKDYGRVVLTAESTDGANILAISTITVVPQVTSIKITDGTAVGGKKTLYLPIATEYKSLTTVTNPEDIGLNELKWSVLEGDSSKFTVDSRGVLHLIGGATVGDKCKFKVEIVGQEASDEIEVELILMEQGQASRLIISSDNSEMSVNDRLKLMARFDSSEMNVDDYNLTWKIEGDAPAGTTITPQGSSCILTSGSEKGSVIVKAYLEGSENIFSTCNIAIKKFMKNLRFVIGS